MQLTSRVAGGRFRRTELAFNLPTTVLIRH